MRLLNAKKTVLVLVPDNRYGSFDPKTKKWSGLIDYIADRHAYLAIADVIVTQNRSKVVTFRQPMLDSDVVIIFTQPETNNFPFNNLEELVNQAAIKCEVVRVGSIYKLFKSSTNPIFKKAYQYFEHNPDVLVASY